MESGEIINNSYKDFGEGNTNENDVDKNKSKLKKIIMISLIITIFVASLTIFLIFYLLKSNEEKEKITCEPGYYLPEDNEDSEECIKCSLEHCKTCHGTKTENTCTQCIPGYMLDNSFCQTEHSIKAIYSTKENGETISLMHYIYTNNIKNMSIDGEIISPPNVEYTFQKSGIHTVYILFDNELDTLQEMFYGNKNLIEINFTYIFDTSNITSFHFMFYSCKNLLSAQMSYFNTTNVETMNGMFQQCSSLSSIDISNFDTQNVESMSVMFSGCTSLKSLDLSNFKTNKLKSMDSMFQGCYNLTYINLKNFDTKNVQYMEGIFEDCKSINSIDISNFVNGNETKMDYMFFGCENLKYLDISGFRNLKNETIRMFYDLPDKGKIVVDGKFLELIKEQIPNDWEIEIKNNSNIFKHSL